MPDASATVFPPLACAAGAPPSRHAARQSTTVAAATNRTPIRSMDPLLHLHYRRERTTAQEATASLKVRSSRHSQRHNGPPMRPKLAIALVAPLVLMGG